MWKNIRKIDSELGSVAKFVFEGENAVAEAVLYRYPDFQTRTVICCSTQSGCPIGCRFCGAGDSFVRSLTSAEILSQVEHALTETGVDPVKMERLQVMFMSMGEPLLNLKEVSKAIEALYGRYPHADLLISTSAPAVDYVPFISLSYKIPTVGLQVSVHESTDEKRDALIPFKKKLPLQEIAKLGLLWNHATGRRPFFNYCAHEGNTSDADADRLRALFTPCIWEATISVVCERNEHVAAANARQRDLARGFVEKLLGLGFSVRMFDPAGQDDIGGGCGQLWYVQDWMRNNASVARPSAGRQLPVIHAPK